MEVSHSVNPDELHCCPAHLLLTSEEDPSVDIPRVVHLKKPETSIGRDKNSVDVFLDSVKAPRMISRIHSHLLHLSDGTWKIKDNHSVNGLFVNDFKVHEAALKDNDRLVFGGGGNLAFGTRKAQEHSEFVYLFKVCPQAEMETDRKKRPRDESDEFAIEERAAKRVKHEDHSSKLEEFRSTLAAKETESEDLKRRLQEFMAKDAELQKKQEEIELREKQRLQEIREQQQRREKELRDAFESELKAKEEAMVAQMKAKEEALKATNQLLEEKLKHAEISNRTFDEELQLLRRTLEQKNQADESDRKMLKDLQDQLKHARDQLQKSSSEYIERSSFEEEFTCSICQELLLDACTLECAHSFCSACLDDWKKRKNECPVCRKKMDKPPVRALNINSIVTKLVSKLPDSEKKEWDSRLAQRGEKEQVAKLQEMIRMAKARGLRFLDIRLPWKPAERQTYLDGVSRYTGEAKRLYCESIGLTNAWVSSSSPAQLTQACRNIGIPVGQRMREDLLQYINDGAHNVAQGKPQRNVIDLT